MSTYNPGGVIEPESWRRDRSSGPVGTLADIHYCQFLDKNGYGRLDTLVEEEAQRSDQASDIIEKVSSADVGGKEFARVLLLMQIGAALLSAMSLLLLARLMSLLVQKRNYPSGLARALQMVTYFGGLIACFELSVFCLHLATQVRFFDGVMQNASDTEIALIQGIGNAEVTISLISITVSTVLSLAAARRARKFGLEILIELLRMCMPCAIASMIVAVAVYEACRCSFQVNNSYLLLSSFGSDNGLQNWTEFLTLFASVLGPILVVVLVSLTIAVKSKSSLLQSILTGIRTAAMPLTCGLFIIFGGVLLTSIRENEKLNAIAQRAFVNDSDYFARSAGSSWPGPLPLREITVASLTGKVTPAHSSE